MPSERCLSRPEDLQPLQSHTHSKKQTVADRYPVLFHMAESGSWESIRERGLRSTSALLDCSRSRGREVRYRIRPAAGDRATRAPEARRGPRPGQQTDAGEIVGAVPARDDDARVVRAPQPAGLLLGRAETPPQAAGREGLQGPVASAVGGGYGGVARTARRPRDAFSDQLRRNLRHEPRGPDPFRRIVDYPERNPFVGLAVDYAVPDVADFVLSVSRWYGVEKLGEVWRWSE